MARSRRARAADSPNFSSVATSTSVRAPPLREVGSADQLRVVGVEPGSAGVVFVIADQVSEHHVRITGRRRIPAVVAGGDLGTLDRVFGGRRDLPLFVVLFADLVGGLPDEPGGD